MATYQEHKIILFVSTGVFALSVGHALGRAGTIGPLRWILFLPALTVLALSYGLDCPLLRMRQRVVRSAAIWSLLLGIHLIPLAMYAALWYPRAALPARTALLLLGSNLLLQLLTVAGTRFWMR
jgi:hypothetical protein